jgi:hypothetical protein
MVPLYVWSSNEYRQSISHGHSLYEGISTAIEEFSGEEAYDLFVSGVKIAIRYHII